MPPSQSGKEWRKENPARPKSEHAKALCRLRGGPMDDHYGRNPCELCRDEYSCPFEKEVKLIKEIANNKEE
jgi:hypothetical protein